MSWLVDNANTWFVLLGILGLGLGMAWWIQRQPRLLLGVAAAVALIALVWLLTRLVVTDRQQLQANIREMANAVVEGKADVLLKHLANDFQFQGRQRQDLVDGIARGAKLYRVSNVVISGFDVEEWQDRSAKVFFRA